MKENLKHLILLFFVLGGLLSCSDKTEEETEELLLEEVETLLTPSNGFTESLTSSSTDFVDFEWEKAKVTSSVVPIYEVLFIKEGGDFSEPIEKIKSDNSGKDNKARISHRQMDLIFKKAGVGEGATSSLMWSVSASSGLQKVVSEKQHKITITRSVPFVVPTELYIVGDATETGAAIGSARKFTMLSSGKFEIFTKLEAKKSFRVIDRNIEKELRTFFIKDGKLEEGENDSSIEKTGIYRVTVDFSTNAATYEEINNFRLIFCINENMIVNLKYEGQGIWKSNPSYLPLPNEGWGKEDRYKFKMKVTANNTSKDLVWGTKYATDSRPSGDASYYYMKESFSDDVWADKWKFKAEYDKKGVVVTAHMQGGKDYTHFIEVVPLNLDWVSIANQGTKTLANQFWNNSAKHFYNNIYGQMRPYDYWPEAHAIDVIIDAYERTKDEAYKQKIYDFHNGVKNKNGGRFYNDFYDDMAWHGLAHLRAFKVTGDTRYEDSARDLWGWLTDGWNDDDGGGIPWNHQNNESGKGKGVPTNGPSTIIAIRRWVEYGDAEIKGTENNLQWAKKIYSWIREHRYEPETGRVFENKNDKGGDWTYNAGTYMGAAMELYNVTKDKMYFDDAVLIADYAMENLSSNFYVLSDWAEQYNEKEDSDHDVNLFKAIFIRYFTRLIMHEELSADKRKQYVEFMENSAKCLWTRATLVTDNSTLFGHRWWEYPKGDKAIQLRTQTSGCAMMEAMALLQSKGYLSK